MSLNNCIASDFAAAAPTFRSRPRNRRVKRGVAVGAKLVKPFLLRDGLFCQSGRGNDVSVRSPAPIEAGSPGRPKSAPSPSPAQTAARVVGRTVFPSQEGSDRPQTLVMADEEWGRANRKGQEIFG